MPVQALSSAKHPNYSSYRLVLHEADHGIILYMLQFNLQIGHLLHVYHDIVLLVCIEQQW